MQSLDSRFQEVVAVLGAAGDEGPSRLHDLGFMVWGLEFGTTWAPRAMRALAACMI